MGVSVEVDVTWAAPCGVCCRLCEFFENPGQLNCGGCYRERICRVSEPTCWFINCTKSHGVEHCGLCSEFPCRELFENHQKCCRESPQIATFRIGDLAMRARMGTSAWLEAKVTGSLPDVWGHCAKAISPAEGENRAHRRMRGCWPVTVSFDPAQEAFGLHDIQAECPDASPSGMCLLLPESAKESFAQLVRTKRRIEVTGMFPTSHGGFLFCGEVIWHDLDSTKPGEGVRLGVRLLDNGV